MECEPAARSQFHLRQVGGHRPQRAAGREMPLTQATSRADEAAPPYAPGQTTACTASSPSQETKTWS
eukprot:7184054-Pyramimonas_sp.AAC.1